MSRFHELSLLGALLAAGCQAREDALPPLAPPPPGAEAVSLTGRALIAPPPTTPGFEALLADLDAARSAHEHDPGDADALIWYGRRLAYVGRHRDATAVFSAGVERHPTDARMLRHRGHRYITLRRFDLAERDLERAAALCAGQPDEVEPDGQPNARGIPVSTLQSNIHYHLGLARYLRSDFDGAARAYRDCMRFSDVPDRLCSTSYWYYLTLRRLGDAAAARALLEPIHAGLDVIENDAYHQLLLHYRGDLALDETGTKDVQHATLAYGIANARFFAADSQGGTRILEALEASDAWASFAVIAAEADLADPARLAMWTATGPGSAAAAER